MASTDPNLKREGLLQDPKGMLLELAGHHVLSDLLPLAVARLASNPNVALAGYGLPFQRHLDMLKLQFRARMSKPKPLSPLGG